MPSSPPTSEPEWVNDPHLYRTFTREEHDGEVIYYRLYTVGAVSQALGKSPVAIRAWIARGVIPDAGFRTAPIIGNLGDKGLRLWTRAQINMLVKLAKQENVYGATRRDCSAFAGRVRFAWAQEKW